MKRTAILALTAAALLALPLVGPAWANDPSVDQIISALKPSAGSLKGNTRGIRAMAPDAPAARHGTRHSGAVVQAADDADASSLDLTVAFQTGSADLTPGARQTVERLGHALASPTLLAYRFKIEGHTDTVGDADTNMKLSQARAEKVAGTLESDFGVAAARLETVGLGKGGLLVPTPDQTAEAKNRRVHVVNLGKA